MHIFGATRALLASERDDSQREAHTAPLLVHDETKPCFSSLQKAVLLRLFLTPHVEQKNTSKKLPKKKSSRNYPSSRYPSQDIKGTHTREHEKNTKQHGEKCKTLANGRVKIEKLTVVTRFSKPHHPLSHKPTGQRRIK